MKTCLIIDETYFFHPKFVNDLCNNENCEIVSAILVKKIPKKNSLSQYLIRNIFKLYFSEIVVLILITLIKKIKELIYIFFKIGFPQSVSSVLKFHKIKFLETNFSLNKNEIIDFIKENEVQLILSSNPLYIPKKILDLDKIVILNRHSSYLPINGGLWPVFYSISKNMNFTGVSIHLVNNLIDSGQIISQKKIKLFSKNLYNLYEKCFDESSSLFFECISIIKKDKVKLNVNIINKINYNTFPDNSDWIKFRKNKGRFAEWENLFKNLNHSR